MNECTVDSVGEGNPGLSVLHNIHSQSSDVIATLALDGRPATQRHSGAQEDHKKTKFIRK